MFDKLLSNLPFNPGLIDQMAFYARRMRKEQSIRRLGLIFTSMALVIQFLAVFSPAQPSLAASNNDLINGGISSASEAAAFCQNNVGSYGDILSNYGISCSDVAHAGTINLHSTDNNRQLFSMGRLPYGISGETPVNVNGGTYYFRYLWGWDTAGPSTYQALQVHSSITGKTFFILYNCGNLVSIGLPSAYTPPQPPKHCPYNATIAITDSRCVPPRCPRNVNILLSDSRCVNCPWSPDYLKADSRCVQCPNPNHSDVTSNSPSCVPVCPYNKSIDKTNAACKPPCQYNSSISSDSPSCKPCTASQSSQDKVSCLVLSKSVSNITQHIANADNTTANAGDTLTYTLSAKNTGKAAVSKFVIQENISDVLDYATVTDLHGGSLDNQTHIVTYPAQDIKAGATATEQITVKVKDPIPSTPVSSSDPGHFDMVMTNVYGNTINVKLPPTTVKTTEQVVSTLPNTGPGTGLIISFGMALVVGYFFARSRLLAKEAEIVVETQVQGAAA